MADNELNHHNDPTGLLQSAGEASSGQYLGDQAVIDRLLRDFAAAVMSRFERVARGLLTPEDASEQDKALCFHMARIVLGKEPGYQPQRDWSEKALPMYVRAVMAASIQVNEDDESVMAQCFALLAHSIYDQIRAGGNDAAIAVEINNAIKSMTWLLLGVEQYE